MSCVFAPLMAETVTDSVTVYFTLQNADVDAAFMCNGEAMEAFDNRLRGYITERGGKIESVTIQGFVSPEGSQTLNNRLSTERTHGLRKFASSYFLIPENSIVMQGKGIDTETLQAMINEDPLISDREDVKHIISGINDENAAEVLSALAAYQDGEPYRYLSSRVFPWMRNASIIATIVCPDAEPSVELTETEPEPVYAPTPEPVTQETPIETATTTTVSRPFYMSVKTNMLYDAALIPNIGIEFYLGKGASIGANWMYAWWSKDSSHRYWRTYGGDIHLRLWLGKKSR